MFNRDRLTQDRIYRIRYMNSLVIQLNHDLEELEELLKKGTGKRLDPLERQKVLEKLAWIKQGVKTFQEMEHGEIEGVISGKFP